MNIYVLIFVLLMAFCVVESIFRLKYVAFLAGLILALLAGCRGPYVGPDTINYVRSFAMQKYNDVSGNFEVGYRIIQKFIYLLGLDYKAFFIAFSLVSLMLLTTFFFETSPLPTVSILYYYSRYFLSRDMNQIRQALATAIAIYSLKYLGERKPIKFLLLVLIAASIHKVALIMIIPYFAINFLRFNEKNLLAKYVVLCILSVIVSYGMNPIISWVGGNSVYVVYSGYTSSLGLLNPVILLEVLISFGCCVFISLNRESIAPIVKNMMLTYMLGSSSLIILNQYAVIGGRVSSFLTTFEAVIVVYLVSMVLRGLPRLMALFIFSGVIFYLINIFSGQIVDYLPYVTSFVAGF